MSETTDRVEKLISFFEKHKSYHYKKGEVIVRPDDEASNIYYIKSGYIRVYRITDWGDIKLQIVYKYDEIFPIHWTFSSDPSIEFFEAMGDVNVLKAPKKEFTQFLIDNPDVLLNVAKRVLSILKIAADRNDNLLFTDAYSRVVARILHLARRFGNTTQGAITIQAPVNQKDIAFSIGMTRETASRCLSKLERKRLITYRDHLIVIRDIDKLREELTLSHERKKL